MWKSTSEEKSGANAASTSGGAAAGAAKAATPVRLAESFRAEIAHIGKSVLIKGELSGSEDLYLDGEVRGSIELSNHSLTVGPHGQVHANIHAREVIIHGKVDGNMTADERLELKKSAVLTGDVSTQRIVIEDGAYFKGSIDIHKDIRQESPSRREMSMAAAAGASHAQSSFLDKKI